MRKRRYRSVANRCLTQADWVDIFKSLDEKNNMGEIMEKTGLRKQVLTEKYALWKKHGENYLYSKCWSNKIFTHEEELKLFMIIWNYEDLTAKEQKFSDSVIERLANKFYQYVKSYRNVKPFKASVGWIIDFRRRFGIRFNSSKSYYHKWEILK